MFPWAGHHMVVDALQFLVGKIKTECVTEIEQKL